MITNLITYFQISLIGRSLFPVTPMLGLTVTEIIFSIVWSTFASTIYHKMYPPHKTLMIYGSEMKSSIKMASSLERKMKKRSDKYRIKEMVDVSVGLDTLKEMMQHYDAVLICDVKTEMRNKILKYCFEKSIRTYITPKISDIIVRSADDIHLFDTPLLLCRNYGLNFEQRVIKRLMDIAGSIICIVIFSPVMLLSAILVKITSSGPLIFKQERVGLHNEKFMMYKFRTMYVQTEEEEKKGWTQKNDPRVTKVGGFLRKTSLDEFPQLFNVLKGDMSLVGPRPERPQYVEKFREEIPRYMIKHQVRPGMTGWAQVNGYRGDTSIRKRIEHDLYYIENWTLGLDIKILFLTVFKGFINKNAY